MMSNGRNRLPFTPSQWQELEHQALIFKYMVSGMPIPSDLLFTIKRSLDSSLSSKLILQPQHVGWNCFQMGFGRKIDPEPGRCRRTDGKKWRCSKEAYPDSKYCERHMHRGRNRSRKPVETNTSTPPPPSSVTTKSTNPSSSSTSHILSPLSSSVVTSDAHHHHNHPCYSSTPLHHHPFLYPHSTSSSRPPGIGLSSQDNNTHFLLDSGPYSHSDKDYRNSYGDGMKEEVDEHAFFQESCGTMRSMSGSGSSSDSWPLTMAHHKHRNGYSYLQLQDSSKQQQNQDQQHYYIPLKSERSENHEHDEPQKVMHHFFDEWPPKNKDSWLDSADKLSNHVPISTTQLSISIPRSSHHDFFMTTHTDK